MPFEFERQKIKDVILVKPKVFGDNRGFFMESYKKSDFFANGIDVEFNQDNHSNQPLMFSEVFIIRQSLTDRQNLSDAGAAGFMMSRLT